MDVNIDSAIDGLKHWPRGSQFGHLSHNHGGAQLYQYVGSRKEMVAEGAEIPVVLDRLARLLGCKVELTPEPLVETRMEVFLIPSVRTLHYESPYNPADDADSEVGNTCIYCGEAAEDCTCGRGA